MSSKINKSFIFFLFMPFILCIAISEVSFFELSSSLLLRTSEFTFLQFLLKKLLFQSFGISLLYFNITPILNISIISYFYIYKQQQQNSFHQNQMSIQNTSSPANFYMNSSMNQTNNFEPQFTQASQYLTKSISGMIKKQLKTYRLQKKLQKEVQDYKKKKQKKQFINQLHKVQKFRNNQNESYRKKYEQFLKKNQQKQNRIQSLIHKKEQQIRTRAIYQNKKLYQVKKRHNQTIQQEINTRLSRIESFQKSNTKLRTANMSLSKISSRCSSSQNYRTIIKDRSESQEQFRITNYLKKMKNAESKILQRQLKNQGRKIKSIQTQVKKLTATRDAYHQNLKQKYEQNYNSKMGSFYSKIQQIQLQNSSYLMNKSMLRSKLRENVLKNKQMNESQLFNKTLTSYMKKTKQSQKENFSSWNHKKLDLLRTQSNFITNSIKMQKQALEEQNQNSMRLVYAKVQKLKMMNDNQKVSQKQKQQILSLINPHDSQYQQIVQFLSCSKEQFLKKQIQKEEQKLNKIKKTGEIINCKNVDQTIHLISFHFIFQIYFYQINFTSKMHAVQNLIHQSLLAKHGKFDSTRFTCQFYKKNVSIQIIILNIFKNFAYYAQRSHIYQPKVNDDFPPGGLWTLTEVWTLLDFP